ncbi:MAG: peptidoglycan DD-metalloendopeptidase family protein [Proteobacteria bacterium]|nr:peptidoglycan DD-metalloendopeptidase family protein [Pseudomonadota bacterium]
MTYRVYIKKDYKPEVVWVGKTTSRSCFFRIVCFVTLLVAGYFITGMNAPDLQEFKPIVSSDTFVANDRKTTIIKNSLITDFVVEHVEDQNQEINPISKIIENEVKSPWQSVVVKSGDSLALIFSKLSLSPVSLYKVMSLGKEVSILKKLRPGQMLNFHIADNELLGLEYEMDLTNSLKISKVNDKFKAEFIQIELEKLVKNASAVINDSLFLSAEKAGLSDNLIMQLVAIYGWDIDFALDIRKGDSFTVIYEEQHKDGIKVADGPIIAAEFVNRDTPLRAVRYTHEDGRIDYYADNGDAMRKAFLRTPVNFTRISSRFNLKRKHPILNKIRAHRGVDYAASTGTPIKATGDGTVTYAGKKGGYGRTLILKHGGKYSTVYAHLHRYARGVRTGKRVKQGQIIAYVGKSGLATGPHLHYEFRVHGIHRNPLTVKIPKVESIRKEALPEFRKIITPILAELDRLTGKSVLTAQRSNIPSNQPDTMMDDG